MKPKSLIRSLVQRDPRVVAFTTLLTFGACHSYDESGYSDDGEWSSKGGSYNGGNHNAPSPAPPQSDLLAPLPQPSAPELGPPLATNPFVEVAHDPFSTFAVDVDTASYDIFRRDVNLGRLPESSQVRVEEFVNAFKYAYPAANLSDETPFAVGLTATKSPFAQGSTLLRVHVQGKPLDAVEKKPANLVYLIDTSGSMHSSDKLGLVKQVARQSLDVLSPTDKVSIVTYAGDTAVRLPPTLVSEKVKIRAAIDRLEAGGGTAGASGIVLAYQQAQAAFIPGGINHVVLCTDGDFNIGVSNTEELVRLIEEKRKTGVTLTALGFGAGNLNDPMMERVSNAGNGVYSVISSEQQAARYVENGLLSSIVHIAKDVKIQVEFNPALVTAYRLLGYENRDIADRDFRNDLVDAGEIGAGHQVTAIYELVLSGTAVPTFANAPAITSGAPVPGVREVQPTDLAMVKVRYKRPSATEADPAKEIQQRLAAGQVLEALADADLDLQWAVSVAAFAELLKRSPYANASHLETIAMIARAQATRDDSRAEFAALLAKAQLMLRL